MNTDGQEQLLGPVQDQLVILDGKEIRHADVESANVVSGTGRWLGSTKVKGCSNEIPAARAQLAKLEVVGIIVLADAAHTQVATAKQILYEQGGHHLLTVKMNQKGLFETLSTLFTEQRFPPPTLHTHAMTRENNRGRHKIRVIDCQNASPQQVCFLGVQTIAIARLRRRVRRKGKNHRNRLSHQQSYPGRVGRRWLSHTQAGLLGHREMPASHPGRDAG